MSKKLKNMLIIFFSITFTFLLTNSTFAHPPAETGHPDKSHIHIKGKITAPDGSLIPIPEGAKVTANASELFGSIMPISCINGTYQRSPINRNTGEYELIFLVYAHRTECRENLFRVPIDPTKIKIEGIPGYDFRRKNQ